MFSLTSSMTFSMLLTRNVSFQRLIPATAEHPISTVGAISPSEAASEPKKPPFTYPTSVAVFRPTGPGVTCATETRLPNALSVRTLSGPTNSSVSSGISM